MEQKPTLDLKKPMACPPHVFSYLKKCLPTVETFGGLLDACMVVPMLLEAKDAANVVRQKLDGIAKVINDRVFSRNNPLTFMSHLHDVLFDEMGFSSETPSPLTMESNSVLDVLETGDGTPAAIGVIYKAVAGRLNVPIQVDGVGFPYKFLVRVTLEKEQMVVDVGDKGRILTVEDAKKLLASYQNTAVPKPDPDMEGNYIESDSGDLIDVTEEPTPWNDEFLKSVSHRHWLTRVLQNCLGALNSTAASRMLASLIELEILMWPGVPRLWRDSGLCLARSGFVRDGSSMLKHYLSTNPDDPQIEELKHLVEEMEKAR